jgi:hypothetical protein
MSSFNFLNNSGSFSACALRILYKIFSECVQKDYLEIRTHHTVILPVNKIKIEFPYIETLGA